MSFALRSGSALAFLVTIAGCASVQPRADESRAPTAVAAASGPRELSPDEQVAHVLSRLTFGARPGDLERVAGLGVDAWIAAQLRPDSVDDSRLNAALASNLAWATPADALTPAQMTTRISFSMVNLARPDTSGKGLSADSVAKLMKARLALLVPSIIGGSDAFSNGKLIHAELGERQLLEVLTDFWENHFSVYTAKMPSQESIEIGRAHV